MHVAQKDVGDDPILFGRQKTIIIGRSTPSSTKTSPDKKEPRAPQPVHHQAHGAQNLASSPRQTLPHTKNETRRLEKNLFLFGLFAHIQ
jgi:hypothetical protein